MALRLRGRGAVGGADPSKFTARYGGRSDSWQLSRRTVGAILLPMLFERFPNMTLLNPASVSWRRRLGGSKFSLS